MHAQPSASWLSGGSSQCQSTPQAAQAPASLGPSAARAALAGLIQAVFSSRPTTDAEFSLSTERQLDFDEEDGRLVTARDDGTETMQRNWPKPFGNW